MNWHPYSNIPEKRASKRAFWNAELCYCFRLFLTQVWWCVCEVSNARSPRMAHQGQAPCQDHCVRRDKHIAAWSSASTPLEGVLLRSSTSVWDPWSRQEEGPHWNQLWGQEGRIRPSQQSRRCKLWQNGSLRRYMSTSWVACDVTSLCVDYNLHTYIPVLCQQMHHCWIRYQRNDPEKTFLGAKIMKLLTCYLG